ncbi:MAG: hypothetical protein IPM35_37115 [Myxococcales bacterium]|nr:hypothetical protein [Myxococcales bacterium]
MRVSGWVAVLGLSACSALPSNACTTGAESRVGCANARTVGRVAAASSNGFSTTPLTCSATNATDQASCSDSGPDHTFRVFLYSGEKITVTLTTQAACSGGGTWYATLKLMTGTCTSSACSGPVYCNANQTTVTHAYTASQDGWHYVMVDGASASSAGTYNLKVALTCKNASCDC